MPDLLVSILLVVPSLSIPEGLEFILSRMLSLLLIALLAWIAILLVFSFRDCMLSRYDISAKDNLKARTVHTQVNVFIKILEIIIGFAAQRSITTLLAGLQLAIT